MAVDAPRDVYVNSKALRGERPAAPYTRQDLLNALYVGIGAMGLEAFYDPLWAAMEAEIVRLEGELGV